MLNGILIVIYLSFFSCENECGKRFKNLNIKIVGLDWVVSKAIYSDTAIQKLKLSKIDNDSVIYDQYCIAITPKQLYYNAQNIKPKKLDWNLDWNFSFIQPVYACKPNMPTSTNEKIDSIVIVSTKDFDNNYRAGTNLAALFDVVVLPNRTNPNYQKYSLQQYLKENPFVPNKLYLVLTKKPSMTTDFTFLVKYYQNGVADNDYFEFWTNKIVIKRDI